MDREEKIVQPKIASREVTTHILKAFGLHMSKKLGQNFLIDAGIVQGIVDAADIQPGERVLEIGPGIGTLTQGLAEAGADVTAVELDKKLPAVLAETLKAYPNVTIVPGDILKVDIPSIMGEGTFKVAANLPYYITTPIIMTLLERRLPIERLVTMVQKEVAERIAEKPGSKTYGILSVLLQAWYDIEYLFTVGSGCFAPPPKVESAVIRLTRNSRMDLGCDEALFKTVVKTAFGQRRKMMRNPLKPLARAKAERSGWSEEQLADFLAQDVFSLRPERLSVEDFVALTNLLA